MFSQLRSILLGAFVLVAVPATAQTLTTIVAPGTTPTYNGIPIINQFRNPVFLTTDNTGTLYFTDGVSNQLDIAMSFMRIAPAGNLNLINPVPVGNELTNDPAGNIYLNRRSEGCIQKNFNTIGYAGTCSLFHDPYSPNGDGESAARARLGLVYSIAADGRGNLYLHEDLASRNVIRIVDASGVIRQFANLGTFRIRSMAAGPDNQLYAYGYPQSGSVGVYRITAGSVTKIVDAPTEAELDPFAIDSDGNFYFATCFTCTSTLIVRVSPSGASGVVASAGLQRGINGLAFDRAGNLFVSEGPVNRNGNTQPSVSPRIVRIGGVSRPFPIPPACTYIFSATPATVSAAGGPLSVLVTTAPTCSWAARLGANTLGSFTFNTIPPALYSGTQTLNFTVTPNFGFSRLLELLAGPERFLVTQAGDPSARPPRVVPPLPQPSCTYSFDRTVIRVPAGGNTQSLDIRAVTSSSNTCIYAVTSSESWTVYSGAATLQANRTISLTFRPNTTTSQRGATVYIGASSVAVVQEASSPATGLPVISAVVNAASYGPVTTRNSVATIVGENLAPSPDVWDSGIVNGRLPQLVNGTRVYINGLPGYPSYVSPTQINFVVPPTDNMDGTVSVEVQTAAGSGFAAVRYTRWAPSFFVIPGAEGKLYPAALYANSRIFVAPVGAIPGVESRPARPGDNIVLYGMGLGFLSSDPQAGQVVTSPLPARDLDLHRIEIGSTNSGFLLSIPRLQYVGMTFAGVYQVNFQIPATGVSPGEWSLSLIFSTERSSQPSVIFALAN